MKKVKQLLGTLLVFTMLLGLMQPTGNLAFAKENNSDSVIVIDEEVSETTTTEAELSTLENSTIEYTPIEQPEGISVRAYAAEGTFPEGTELIVTEIRSEGDTSEQYTDVENALNETDTEYTDFIILDISFYHNGLEIEPEDGTVQVSIELNTEKLPENVDTESIVVQHFKETSDGYVIEEVADSKDVTEGTVEVSSEEQILIDFEVDSFSSYTITFTSGYDNTLKDYDGDAISLDAYNAMLAKISTTVERASNLNEAVVNLPITNWKRTDESKTGDNQEYITLDVPDTLGKNGTQKPATSGTVEIEWDWSDVKGIDLGITDATKVWDGSRLVSENGTYSTNHIFGTYLSSNTITADVSASVLYDSATWNCYTTGKGEYTMYRFQGTFTLPEGMNPQEYSFTIRPVTQSSGDTNIYINDDIYVFVYPESYLTTNSSQINDENFTDYLAMWAGTSTNSFSRKTINDNNEVIKDTNGMPDLWDNVLFQDRTATPAQQAPDSGKVGFKKLTDGWNMKAVQDNAGGALLAGYKATQERTYVVDIFVSDYSEGGGTYRLVAEAEKITRIPVKLKKVDSDYGTALAGAKFALDGTGDKTGLRYTATTDSNGLAVLDVVPGTYTLSEIEAPDNYNLVTTTWTVTVEADGSYTITDNSENTSCEYTSSSTDVFEIENIAKTRTLTISKTVTGNVGDKSKDFDFTLVLTKDSTNYTDDLVANTETLKANTSGTYSFNLKDGESITITVPYGYTYTVDESDYSSEGYTTTITSGNKSDVIVKDSSVSFENNKEVSIETGVDTGTPIYPIVLLGIIGLCFISLIVIFFRRKKLY